MHIDVEFFPGSMAPEEQWLPSHSPAAISYQELLSNGQVITKPSPFYARKLKSLILCRSCADNHGCCQSMSTMVLPIPEDGVPQHPPHSLTLRFSPSPLSLCSLSLGGSGGGGGGGDTDVWLRSEHLVVTSQQLLYFPCMPFQSFRAFLVSQHQKSVLNNVLLWRNFLSI